MKYHIVSAAQETSVSVHGPGIHTKYSWELLRVTISVNAGAT
jgi:hypothetical protein